MARSIWPVARKNVCLIKIQEDKLSSDTLRRVDYKIVCSMLKGHSKYHLYFPETFNGNIFLLQEQDFFIEVF